MEFADGGSHYPTPSSVFASCGRSAGWRTPKLSWSIRSSSTSMRWLEGVLKHSLCLRHLRGGFHLVPIPLDSPFFFIGRPPALDSIGSAPVLLDFPCWPFMYTICDSDPSASLPFLKQHVDTSTSKMLSSTELTIMESNMGILF